MKKDINKGKIYLRRNEISQIQQAMIAAEQYMKDKEPREKELGFRGRFVKAFNETGSIEQAKKMANIGNRFSDEILKRWIEESRGIKKVDDGWDR